MKRPKGTKDVDVVGKHPDSHPPLDIEVLKAALADWERIKDEAGDRMVIHPRILSC